MGEEAHDPGEGLLLYPAHQFQWESLLEVPTQTHPEMIFNRIAGHPVAHSG